MRQPYSTLFALGLTTIAFGAAAQNRGAPPATEAPPVSQQTQAVQGKAAEFLLEALRSSKAEARLGELAAERSRTPAVQQFGRTLAADHAKAADEIEALLEPLNMNVPTEPSAMQHTHHSALAALSGDEFDRAFVPLMIASHREAIDKYEAQTHANPDEQVAELAKSQLPALRAHLATAESLQQR